MPAGGIAGSSAIFAGSSAVACRVITSGSAAPPWVQVPVTVSPSLETFR